jgi:nitrogen regulatory protein PII
MGLKMVEAIIRPQVLDRVIEELQGLNYPGMTITEVRGHGKQKGMRQSWRGDAYVIEFIPKLKLEIAVLAEDADRVINALVRAARTGAPGDGKIFLFDLEDAVRVRTGESNSSAI